MCSVAHFRCFVPSLLCLWLWKRQRTSSGPGWPACIAFCKIYTPPRKQRLLKKRRLRRPRKRFVVQFQLQPLPIAFATVALTPAVVVPHLSAEAGTPAPTVLNLQLRAELCSKQPRVCDYICVVRTCAHTRVAASTSCSAVASGSNLSIYACGHAVF